MRARRRRCIASERVTFQGLGSFVRCAAFEKSEALFGEGDEDSDTTEENDMNAKKIGKFSSARSAGDAGGELAGLFDGDMGLYWGEMNPAWGAIIGGGLAGVGLLAGKALRGKLPRAAKYGWAVSAAAGGIPSLVAVFFPAYRRAGYMGLAATAIVSGVEFIRAMFVEPQLNDFGAYAAEMTGAGLEILDAQADALAEQMIDGALGQGQAPGINILGQPGGQGMGSIYQTEMAASPIEMGALGGPIVQPYAR